MSWNGFALALNVGCIAKLILIGSPSTLPNIMGIPWCIIDVSSFHHLVQISHTFSSVNSH